MEYIETILIVMIELLCYRFYIDVFAEKRKARISEYIFWLMVMSVITVISKLPFPFIIIECTMIVILSLCVLYYYQMSVKKSFVCAGSFVVILLLSDLITYLIYDKVLYVENGSEELANMLIIFMSKCVLLLLVLLIRHFAGSRYKDSINNIDWLKFIVFPILSIVMISVLLRDGFALLTQAQKNVLWMLVFLLLAMNLFMFLYIQDIDKKNSLQHENYVLEMDRKTQRVLYESIENGLEKQRALSHDYKNHIVCIQTMLEQGKYDEAKSYLEKISGIISHNLDMIDTNHTAVNAIVNVKYQEALNKNIMVVCKVNDLSHITMDDSDLVLILSNLLNNAIEACEKCEGKRVMKFKFLAENDDITLSIQNTYNGVVLKNGEKFLTTKEKDSEMHGIGLNNIIKTVEKYNGFYDISYDDKEFHVLIDIPQKVNNL